METKRDIRKMMTALRAAMSEKERAEAGRIIAARLFSSKVYEDAGTVCCYASFGSEVPTEEIIEESLRRGKCAAVPKVTGKQKMKFALIHSMADLKAGFHGIPEPESWCREIPKCGSKLLVIVPGVVFDRAGNRIGYGGGYYDSYLKQADCIKVGVAFDFQCVEQIVPEVHDVPVDYIITEKEMDHMSAGLPRDPVMLLSVVNTKLRDYYSTLDVLCEDMQVDKQELIGKLEMIDYTYDAGSNQFV